MRVDGKKIRDGIKERLTKDVSLLEEKPQLNVVYVGENAVIDRYVGIKESFGHDIGVEVKIHRFLADIEERELMGNVTALVDEGQPIIVQLPLPEHLNVETILDLVPHSLDPDMLSAESAEMFKEGKSAILPPVVASVKEILDYHCVDLDDKNIVIVGEGKLVGEPVRTWLINEGHSPVVLEKGGDQSVLLDADIVISGAGDPHFIKPDMVKEGVVLIDAGTSDAAGVTMGDIDLACEDKATVFAAVPGGVGPITVAKLFENTVNLSRT